MQRYLYSINIKRTPYRRYLLLGEWAISFISQIESNRLFFRLWSFFGFSLSGFIKPIPSPIMQAPSIINNVVISNSFLLLFTANISNYSESCKGKSLFVREKP